jgi:inner membrane protein
MDPFTHALSGMAASFCLPLNKKRQHVFCILAASLPDIDNLAFLWGHEAYLIHHRGFCHSFAGGFLLAVILLLIYRRFDKDFAWYKVLCLAYFLVGLHLFLDVITSYGTQLLLPLSNHRWSMPCVFIIDFLLTGTLAAGVFGACVVKKHRKKIALFTMTFIFLYPGFCKIIHFFQLERSKTVLSHEIKDIHHITVLPDLCAPIYWKIIIEKENYYELRHLSILKDIRLSKSYRYKKADLNQMIKTTPHISFLKTFAWFVDFPVEKQENINQMKSITVFDLKFVTVIPWLKIQRDNRMPFQLHLFYNEQRELKTYYLGTHSTNDNYVE